MDPEGKRIIFILVVVVAVGWLIARTIWRRLVDSSAGDIQTQIEQLLTARKDFEPTHKFFSVTSRSLLAIDAQRRLLSGYFVKDGTIYVRTIAVDAIIDLQIQSDEQSEVTGVGTAISGDSSILATGKAFSSTSVRNLSLHLLISDVNNPTLVHQFLSSEMHGKFESTSAYVTDAIEQITQAKAVLSVLLAQASVPPSPSVGTLSREAGTRPSAQAVMSDSDLRESLRQMAATQFKVQNNVIGDSATFESMAGDSLDAIELIMAVEAKYSVELREDQLTAVHARFTLEDWIKYIANMPNFDRVAR